MKNHGTRLPFDGKDAGPGTYRVPDIIGKKPVESSIRGEPMYSFSKVASRSRCGRLFLSKEHCKHILPTNVPGVGQYDPEKLRLVQNLPSIAIDRAIRFAPVTKLASFKQNVYALSLDPSP